MKVTLLLESSSEAKEYENVDAVYQKGDFLCIASKQKNWVHKYPIANVFRVVHAYDPSDED